MWLAAIILALNFSSPIAAGPAGILVVFLLFYLFTASVIYALITGLLAFGQLFGKKNFLLGRQTLYISFVVALGPIFLIALNTLGQIGIVEVLLVFLLVGLGCFYVIRRYN
jgi:hypothetical protein